MPTGRQVRAKVRQRRRLLLVAARELDRQERWKTWKVAFAPTRQPLVRAARTAVMTDATRPWQNRTLLCPPAGRQVRAKVCHWRVLLLVTVCVFRKQERWKAWAVALAGTRQPLAFAERMAVIVAATRPRQN